MLCRTCANGRTVMAWRWGCWSLRLLVGRSGRLGWTCFPVCGECRITLGGDKNYDTRGFVAKCREMRVTPQVAQNTKGRASAIDGRTTRHPGYAISQRVRKRVEEIFGWTKTVGGGRKLRYIGVARNQAVVGPDGGRLQPGPDGQIGSKPGLKAGQKPHPG